jgi:SOS-response transcriptional repressor LexA
MRQALAAALDAGVYPELLATQPRPSQASRPVAPRPGAAWPNRSDPAASAPAPATLGRGGLRPGYIEGFPLQGVVQAGSFSPIAAQPAQPVHFEIQQVVIRQQAYSIRSPYPDAKVLSLDSENYFLLQVSGDSMNRIIQPGDYVLVRRQRSALSGDIVVAEIRGIDGRAALKRYYQPSPSRTQLRPESSNPLHQVYEAQPGDANYTILGKVIAVFQLVG